MEKTICVFLILGLGITLSLPAQLIPDDYEHSWAYAGFTDPIPTVSGTIDVTDAPYSAQGDGTTDDQAAIQQAIDDLAASLSGNTGVVYLPAGTYRLSSTLTLKEGIILRGAGASFTSLVYDQATGHAIQAVGSLGSSTYSISTAPDRGDLAFTVSDASTINVGDFLRIYFNDAALVDWAVNSVGQLVKVTQKSGNTVTVDVPFRRSYAGAASLTARKYTPVEYVGIENLKITRSVANPSADANSSYANITLRYADHCWVSGVESSFTDRAHIDIWYGSHIEIRNNYFHQGHSYGGGKAYGVLLQFTTGDCLIEDNVFQNLRHSILLQAGANGNVISYNYSREIQYELGIPAYADLVLHGNYPYANLFEGNIGQWALADQQGEMNGPGNTFFRNRIEDVGIVNSESNTDSLILVGNEITGDGLTFIFSIYDEIDLSGSNHFLCKNHSAGSLSNGNCASNADTDGVASLYLTSTPPDFWPVDISFPPFGSISSTADGNDLPAKQRYEASQTIAPVTWLGASATASATGIEVAWTTGSELNNDHFVVERMHFRGTWTDIGSVKSQGDSETPQAYALWDTQPSGGVVYYRIRQVDIDGTFQHSPIVSTQVDVTQAVVRVAPNPVHETLILHIESQEPQAHFFLNILDNMGRRVYQGSITATTPWEMSVAGWSAGLYHVQVYTETGKQLSSLKVRKR